MSDAPHLTTSEDGAILIATLNRPEKLNALSGQMMGLFETALHRSKSC
jgi:enoyl-CoA hydratase